MRERIAVVAGVVLLTLSGCSKKAERCVVGKSVACPCPGGEQGTQTCTAEGKLGPCRCVVTARPPAPDATPAAGGCHGGVITFELGNNRGAELSEVACEGGSPSITSWESYHGEPEQRETRPISMAQWEEIWRLADAAGWKDTEGFCTEEAGEPRSAIEVRRSGAERVLACAGTFAPPVQALWRATRIRAAGEK